MACKTVVACYLKTESGDGYLFVYDDLFGIDDFVQRVDYDMGEEFPYVCDIHVETTTTQKDGYVKALIDRLVEVRNQ